MKKILITGASGFLGRNVREYLMRQEKEYEIFAPSSRELDCLNESMVAEYLKKNRFDYVLHFAVYGDAINKSRDSTKILEYNLRMFWNFAKHASLFGKLFYTGSGAEYDKRFPIEKVTECDIGKSIPVDQYGLMKYTVGQAIENSNNLYNFRLFGIFGKYEQYSTKFISNICCKAIQGLPLTMRQNVYFDYLWVEDFCRMLEFFLNNTPQYHTYNMVSGNSVSLEELCRLVCRISEKDLSVYICKKGLANEYTASNMRFLKENPGFQYTGMEEAISQLFRWYETQEIDMYSLLY